MPEFACPDEETAVRTGGPFGHLEETPLAASGNRLVAVGRLGVAFFATAAVALGSALPASAQDPAPAPATETTPAETTPAATTPTAATEATEPKAPTPEPAAAPKEPAPPPDAQPAGGAAESATPAATGPAPESAPVESTPAQSTPAQSTPVASEPAAAPGPVVKLEPAAPTSTPTAPLAAPTTQTTTQPTQTTTQPTPTTAAAVTFQLQEPTVEPQPSATEAANSDGETAPTAHIVSLKEPAAAAPISLLPADEAAAEVVRAIRASGVVGKPLVQRTCTRPTARVPLSQRCKQARAIAVLRATLISSPSPEVRAAIDRVAARVTIQRVEARPPPESKAAKKHTVAKARPIVPFGHSGQGIVSDGFNGATGTTSSSRLFALAAVPLRVPLPFRFARLRLPSTRPHGVIAAPPTARPG